MRNKYKGKRESKVKEGLADETAGRPEGRSPGPRTRTRVESSPGPAAESAQPSGVTPLARTATIETVRNVTPGPERTYDLGTGEIFHDYEIFTPTKNKLKLVQRYIDLSPYGYFGKTPVGTGHDRVVEFYDTLYDKLVQKAVIRDGYRHLPDSETVKIFTAYPYLWMYAVRQIRTILILINSRDWNDATRAVSGSFTGLYRRASESWEALKTFQVPELYRKLALNGAPFSDAPGSTLVIDWMILYPDTTGMGDLLTTIVDWGNGSHTGFGNVATYNSKSEVEGSLVEVENIIRVLRYQPMGTCVGLDGSTCDDTYQTGAQNDLKYGITLLHELVYPAGLPDVGEINIDPVKFNNELYGEAIYYTFSEVST